MEIYHDYVKNNIFPDIYNLHYEKFSDGTVKCIEDQIVVTVPSSWAWVKMSTIAFVTKLAGFEYTKNVAPNLMSDGVPLFKGKNIQNGEIIYEFESFIPLEVSNELSRSQITKKCLLTPYVGTIGNIGIHDKNGVYHLGSNVGKIELYNDTETLLEEYVLAYLRSQFGNKQLTKHMKATAQASISIEAIRDVYIPIPPADEQKRICTEIEIALGFVNNVETEKENISHLIDITKSKILDLAIRGKLVPQDPSDEPAAVLLERIRAEKEALIKTGKIKRDKKESIIFKGEDNSYYRDIPDSWSTCSLINISEIELGKTLDKAKNTGTLYPYLRSVNVQWNAIDLTNTNEMRFESDEIERYSVCKNDLLICEGGDVGRCCVWNGDPFLYQNALHRVRFYEGCNPYFFMYVLMLLESYGYLKKISNGVTIKHLTKSILCTIQFPLPPLGEQNRIVEAIETAFAQLDAIANSLL